MANLRSSMDREVTRHVRSVLCVYHSHNVTKHFGRTKEGRKNFEGVYTVLDERERIILQVCIMSKTGDDPRRRFRSWSSAKSCSSMDRLPRFTGIAVERIAISYQQLPSVRDLFPLVSALESFERTGDSIVKLVGAQAMTTPRTCVSTAGDELRLPHGIEA